MIKVIAFDLVGVLVSEKMIKLTSDEEKIERLFGPNKSDNEFILLSKEKIGNKPVLDIATNIIYKLYKVRQENIIEQIKEKYPNIKIVIATNHISLIKKYIENNFKLIDDIIISADIGMIKPNSDFYKYILNKLNIESSELLFLDDNQNNINGANNIGINTIKVEKNMDLFCEIDKFIKNIETREI